MYLAIAAIVLCLFAIPALIFWLLRPRKDVTPGPYHDAVNEAARKTGGGAGGGGP